ncbi:hypothetical protein [Sphaerisporangium fuscum]|uniref:hypothetical protein n=1 Tax=Sphaerisporangium fuscum TaxID=2835868 RepID=UPI001BDC8EFE|nr:hypothetical protein [Sphaerisporangium fuscum]
MNMRTTVRALAAITALAGGLLTTAGTASAATTYGAGNYVSIAPGATTQLRVMCPSYAPTMIPGSVSFTTKPGATVLGYSVDTDSDRWSRDMLTATVQNTSAAWSGAWVNVTCTN